MSLEKRDSTQICTWQPPLPQRAFPVTSYGSTSEDMPWGGPDGQRYGYFALNTTQWKAGEGVHTPPVNTGEQFQLWTAASGSTFQLPVPFDQGKINKNTTSLSTLGSPDLFSVYPNTIPGATPNAANRDGLSSASAPLWTLKDPTVCTVAGTAQNSSGTWYVYFSPQLAQTEVISPGKDGIITVPRLSSPRWLGAIGHVSGIDYIYALPGGPSQLTCVLQVEPNFRTDALNPGRVVTAHRGGSCIWEGILAEPAPASTGWTLTANGVGTYGTNFGAWWDLTLGSAGWTHIDAPVDFAIARGLRWVNRGIGHPQTIWEGPEQDPGSLTVTDFLNLLTTGGALTWELVQPASASSFPPGPWEMKVYPLPTDYSGNPAVINEANRVQPSTVLGAPYKRLDRFAAEARVPPDLYLVNVNPVPRTILADINTVIVYYQVSPDVTATSSKPAAAAVFATTFADQPSSVAVHGRMEYFVDITTGGMGSYTRAEATAIGANILAKYIRANFSQAFSVMPGQLLNTGGMPVDLGCNWGGCTVSVQVENGAFGGEVAFAPITFVIGTYEFNEESQTAQVTPYQSALTDIASVISAIFPGQFG